MPIPLVFSLYVSLKYCDKLFVSIFVVRIRCATINTKNNAPVKYMKYFLLISYLVLPMPIAQKNMLTRQSGYADNPNTPSKKFFKKLFGTHKNTKQIALKLKSVIKTNFFVLIIDGCLVLTSLSFFSFFCLEVFNVDLYIDTISLLIFIYYNCSR